jgi:hypothetical protein
MKPLPVARRPTDRRSFIELVHDLHQMKAWLTYLGIDIAATRLDQYSQDITEQALERTAGQAACHGRISVVGDRSIPDR